MTDGVTNGMTDVAVQSGKQPELLDNKRFPQAHEFAQLNFPFVTRCVTRHSRALEAGAALAPGSMRGGDQIGHVGLTTGNSE